MSIAMRRLAIPPSLAMRHPPSLAMRHPPSLARALCSLPPLTTTPSGLMYRDVFVPASDSAVAASGMSVSVHYTGRLEDGAVFDSSIDRGVPIQFTLGAREVIRGWDEGINGMAVNQRRQLVIPPQLGYGARGAPPAIPPNALLHFDVELVEIGETSRGGLWSKIASVLKALPLK